MEETDFREAVIETITLTKPAEFAQMDFRHAIEFKIITKDLDVVGVHGNFRWRRDDKAV